MLLHTFPDSLPSASASLSSSLGPIQPFFNLRLFLPFVAFPLLFIALLIVLPGIREQRALSLLAVSLQLSIGFLLIGSILLPFWKVSSGSSPQLSSRTEVLVQLRADSRQRHVVLLGVAVGLRAVNISLDYIRPEEDTDQRSNAGPAVPSELHLNEQFQLDRVSAMADELDKAFRDGSPFPVLRVLEYFSLGQEAFAWGRRFRNAGHFVHALLWASFSVWLLQCLLLALLPHHFAKAGLLCGLLVLCADALFVSLAPSDLHIPFPAPRSSSPIFLHFRFGVCFWMSVSAALLALLFSSVLCVLQSFRLYSLHTFLSSALDDTVGPARCRFGGGRRAILESCAATALCVSGKTSWTVSECSLASSASASSASPSSASVSLPLSKSSVASSVSAVSLCSARVPRQRRREDGTVGAATTKSVDLIRKRIQQQNNHRRMMAMIDGSIPETEGPNGEEGGRRMDGEEGQHRNEETEEDEPKSRTPGSAETRWAR